MMNSIRHNHPSLIQCLRVFSYWSLLRYFAAAATVTLLVLLLSYYLAIDTLLQTLNLSGVVELTTQLLILENIFWLPLESNQ